jgi:peptide-methionine (S)-S-oxide reductase
VFVLAMAAVCPSLAAPPSAKSATAVFAGGCFWCIEADFEKLPGVLDVESGYTGGHVPDPDYEQVSAGGTGHAEAVRVRYDPARVSYAALLDYFWKHIDPTVKDRQFCDTGSQYRSAIFPATEEERRAAEASRDALVVLGAFSRVFTTIEPAGIPSGREYHRDYYRKEPVALRVLPPQLRAGCARRRALGHRALRRRVRLERRLYIDTVTGVIHPAGSAPDANPFAP